LVYFYLTVTDYAAELEAREEMLLRIMDLAKELGVDFAFPTRTLLIEAAREEHDMTVPREAVGAVFGRR
jgi:MscS family membrane protein